MARHEAEICAGPNKEIEVRCLCGWSHALGACPTITDVNNAFGSHYRELRGPMTWGTHVMFGWDDESPIPGFPHAAPPSG